MQYCEPINALFLNSDNNSTKHVYRYNVSTGILQTWKPHPSINTCNWIAVSNDGLYIYAMYANQTSNQMYRTNDGGNTWVAQTILNGTNMNSYVYCSPNGQYVYVQNGGTSIVTSSNYGVTWVNNTTYAGHGVNLNQFKNTLYATNGTTLYTIY
jgi:6-phosphogluconolactonase (cycloisomerase 2 family)